MLNMIDSIPIAYLKLFGMFILYLFMPLTALTYYFFRRHRREIEIQRIFSRLHVAPEYKKAYEDEKPGRFFLYAVVYMSVVSFIGLLILFMGTEIKIEEFWSVKVGNAVYPAKGSVFIIGMAFLGAFMWGLQHIFRRFSLNDLYPSVYYRLSIRMILAAIIALLIFNAYKALVGGNGISFNIWPALAFLIGMFPRRGLHWLMGRLPIFSSVIDTSDQRAPLELIQGITIDDIIRLEELGIDSCYDLATYDFVPLVLKTPYCGRELVDWILQAKLCVYVGEAVKDLRKQGIRTITDLKKLTPDSSDLVKVAQETSVTKSALEHALQHLEENKVEIERLHEAEKELSIFWEKGNKSTPQFK